VKDHGMPLDLRHRFDVDQLLRYHASTSITQEVVEGGTSMGSQSVSWQTEIVQRVLDTEGDGAAHIVQTTVPLAESPQAAAMELPLERQVAYVLMDARGRIREKSDANTAPFCTLAEGPVEAGASWVVDNQIFFPFLAGPVSYRSTLTLSGVEEMDGRSCARIGIHADDTTARVPLADGSDSVRIDLSSEGTAWFDPDAGRLLRLQIRTVTRPRIRETLYDTVTTLTQQLVDEGRWGPETHPD